MSESQISPTEAFNSALEQIKEISQVGGTENPQVEFIISVHKDEVSSDSFKHKKRAIVLSKDALKLYAQGLLYVTEERSFYECASDGTYASIRDDHLRDKLKQKYQLSSNSSDPKILSPQKQVMPYIQNGQMCERAICFEPINYQN